MAERGTGSDAAAEQRARVDVAARLAIAVGRINRRIRSSEDSLSYGKLSALSSILRLGPLRPGDLARVESITAPSVTRLVGSLEASGFVTRSPDPADGRAFFIEATDAGAREVLRARTQRAGSMADILATCSDDELARVAAALGVLESVAGVGADRDESAPRPR
ncbi:MarR family winged helix-turn-helix transcriptional regulator [Glaciibacter sp. 2TAF33]|uniref:MarR family winged helix-turn-helix transcriptional regulator n=1 Tax=Glaciibacter sp. 2TAF33 TaxID=3233015 RepID=UPI003F919FE0